MPWIAAKRQKVTRDGKAVDVEVGEVIPEADHWPNQKAMVRMRVIRWIDRPIPVEKEKPKKAAVSVEIEPEIKDIKPVTKAKAKADVKKKAVKKPKAKK